MFCIELDAFDAQHIEEEFADDAWRGRVIQREGHELPRDTDIFEFDIHIVDAQEAFAGGDGWQFWLIFLR